MKEKKIAGVFRKIDKYGRTYIAPEHRKKMGIFQEEVVFMSYDEDTKKLNIELVKEKGNDFSENN